MPYYRNSKYAPLNRRERGLVPPFRPNEIGGLLLWLRADTGLFQDTGGGSPVTAHGQYVKRWEDQSGNANHATEALDVEAPIANQGGSGRLGVYFYQGGSLTLPLAEGASNWTVFILFDGSNVVAADGQYFMDAQTGRFILANRIGAGDPDHVAWYDGGWDYIAPSQIGMQVLTYSLDSSDTGEIFRDYDSLGTAAYTQMAIGGTVHLGNTYNSTPTTSAEIRGNVYQFLIYNTALTQAQRVKVIGYLTAYSWGLHSTQAVYYLGDWSSLPGKTLVRYLYDVDGDDEKELVCNVGGRAYFRAYKTDGTAEWTTNVNNTQSIAAYYPKIYAGHLYYGDRDADKLYKIRLSDGVKIWESAVLTGLVCMELTDQGIAVGYGTTFDILTFAAGTTVGGNFPITLGTVAYEQTLAAGDLDDDGNDEFFVGDNAGHIYAYDHDGSVMWTITSSHDHTDSIVIYDITGDGNSELVVIVDDDDSNPGVEGDEIAIYNSSGTQLDKYTVTEADTSGVLLAVGEIGSTGKIAFVAEDEDTVGVLDKNLDIVWQVDGTPATGRTSQLALLDIDNDGVLEVLTNVGEVATGDFRVHDGNDGTLKAYVVERGWDFDPPIERKTGQHRIGNDMDSDGYDEVMQGLARTTSDVEIIYVLGWAHN